MSAAPLLARGFSAEDLNEIKLDPTNTGDATAWPWSGHVQWGRIPPGERGATLLDIHDYARWKWATEHAGEKRWASQVARLWELTTTAEAARRAGQLVVEAEQERLAAQEAERDAREAKEKLTQIQPLVEKAVKKQVQDKLNLKPRSLMITPNDLEPYMRRHPIKEAKRDIWITEAVEYFATRKKNRINVGERTVGKLLVAMGVRWPKKRT